MLVLMQILATLSAGLFAGAAIYISLVEHPVRTILNTRAAATQWAPSYKRATWMQAPLAIVGLLTGALAGILGGGFGWLIGAVLIGSVVPITFKIIMPTNQRLLEPGRDLDSSETRALLDKWGQLHLIRSGLSLLAFLLFAWLQSET
ncbi:uncharacterized protein DUF1772 [Nitrosomonas sp. Nm84]|uniref:DUF1772 domain-containing protein n=1 Tax=Nitrosomonas sp. Nm84 TaxID=200124 RepID=UPI000D757C0C|nr:DUF1772 domain-containing protein [Nitrosomonas sp. Nm84]PXW79689.1 uncharacterized protein DUF1772 [Nitrosomonas sp. Nm84]